jgi:hypothetical protein
MMLLVAWLLAPVSYRFTDQGFSLESGRFHAWTEFSAIRRAGSTVQLRRPGGGRGASLFLNEAQQQAVLPLMRRQLSLRRERT